MSGRPRTGAHDVVLFDVFGTLVDYEAEQSRLAYPATHALLAGWGLQDDHDRFVASWTAASQALEVAAIASRIEYGMPAMAAAYAATCGLTLEEAQLEELAACFLAEWQRGIRPIAGLDDMLRRLARTHRLGVVSNTHDPAMVPDLLDRLGVGELFDVVVLSIDHGYRKPDPSIYRVALDALGCPPERAAFVGDNHEADYVGPTAVGMSAWLVDPHGRSRVHPARRLRTVLDVEHRL